MVASCALLAWAATAQNPNWTMPGRYFKPSTDTYSPLPQSPNGYLGDPSARTHGAYTGPDKEILFFTVDEYVYNKEGVLSGELAVGSDLKGGYSEKLILPMGNDCSKFAILYSSASNQSDVFSGALRLQNLYMAVYDIDLPNPFAAGNTGTLLEYAPFTTLRDLSKRDGELY
jgi:hypothetical protein